MGVYGDLMGIFIGSFMGFTGIYIYILWLVVLSHPSEKYESVGVTIPN
jgi:hypothetical protein